MAIHFLVGALGYLVSEGFSTWNIIKFVSLRCFREPICQHVQLIMSRTDDACWGIRGMNYYYEPQQADSISPHAHHLDVKRISR